MEQYVVRYTGMLSADPSETQQVRSFPGVRVLDETPRMLLVAAAPETAAALGAALPHWLVSPERVFNVISPHQTLLHRSGDE